MTIDKIFTQNWFGNTLFEYGVAITIFVVASIVFAILQRVIIVRLKKLAHKTKTDIDDTLIEIVQGVRPQFYLFLSAYLGIKTLTLSALVGKVLGAILLIWVAVQVVYALQSLIDYAVNKKASKDDDPGSVAAFSYLSTFVKWLLWVLATLLILANFGIDVTSVLAGLGVMGIAVGFALKNILADLFSSFAIYFDKPFQVGDYIQIGDYAGTVEKIGIKTTRIRTRQGEELVVSNQELTNAKIQNFRKLKERRVSFRIGVLYETPYEKVEKIPSLVENIFSNIEKVRLDRVHFSELGDSSLVFDVVYYVESKEYLDKMNIQQDINLALVKVFEREGIGFAYPTQTLHIVK